MADNTVANLDVKSTVAGPKVASDALVFFGATGDLAHKKIFPALQAMVKRGNLNVPVIGVAKAGWTSSNFASVRATALPNSAAAWMKLRSRNW